MLSQLVEQSRQQAEQRQVRRSLSEVKAMALSARQPLDFLQAFHGDGPNIIAEVKFASPSEGVIHRGLSPVEVTRGYLEAGAAAISVLTESHHFGGSVHFLQQLSAEFPEVCFLKKDFISTDYQVFEAKAFGASAFLLIADILSPSCLADLVDLGLSLGLCPLVEVHSPEALEEAHRTRAQLIGINNRNLQTMKTSLDTSFRLAGAQQSGRTYISESGLSSLQQLKELQRVGYKGFLVGTSFMKSENPGRQLAKVLSS